MQENGKNLSPESSDQLEKLAATIQLNSGPFNQGHEGFHNLLPNKQDRFIELLAA